MGDTDSAYIYLLKELKADELSFSNSKIIDFYAKGWQIALAKDFPFLLEQINLAYQALAKYQELGIKVTNFFSKDYPPQLKELANPPMLLYYYGDITNYHQSKNNLSIVGTRNASVYGQSACKILVNSLRNSTYKIISGLAYGIDTVAHETALETGLETSAILGCGLLQITEQAHNRSLIAQLKANPRNLILSEFEPKREAQKWTFPLRNRIIADLSQSTIVIEAGLRSGSLITANEAIKLKRRIYTIPASWGKASFAGNQELLTQGKAELIYDPMQFTQLQDTIEARVCIKPVAVQHPILDLIEVEPVNFDYLLNKLGLTSQALCKELTLLELQGVITKTSAGRYVKSLCKSS